MDGRRNIAVPYTAKEAWNGFSYPEQLLPQKNQKSVESIGMPM
jgi:hypothetical protein